MSFFVDNIVGNNNVNIMVLDFCLIYYDIVFVVFCEKNIVVFNFWKVCYVFNFKGIFYKIEWVQMFDIIKVCKGFGVLVCWKFVDGIDYYILLVLKDSIIGVIVGDLFDIVFYFQEMFFDFGFGDLFFEQFDLNYVCFGVEEVLILLSKREDVQYKDYFKFNMNVDWVFILYMVLMVLGMKWDKEFE